jgi:hypothetical protein
MAPSASLRPALEDIQVRARLTELEKGEAEKGGA